MKPLPARFRAADGTEFATAEEALAHESLAEALGLYNRARKALGLAIAKMCLTADGLPFVPDRPYWRVSEPYGQPPSLVTVGSATTWPSWTEFRVEGGQVVTAPERGHKTERPSVRVSDLYASEAAALKACLAAHDQHRGWYDADRRRLAERLEKLGGAP